MAHLNHGVVQGEITGHSIKRYIRLITSNSLERQSARLYPPSQLRLTGINQLSYFWDFTL